MMTMAMVLGAVDPLAAIMTKMFEIMIGVPAVAIRVIKSMARGVVKMVILATVDTRAANPKAGQEAKILVLMD